MKIYTDKVNGVIISVNDEGKGFPISQFIYLRYGKDTPETHKEAINACIENIVDGTCEGNILHDQPFNTQSSFVAYHGLTLDEVIEKFCPEAPEEI